MSVRAIGLGSARNGLADNWRPYVYRGTGEDVLAPRLAAAAGNRRPGLPGRVLAALRSLGGEASTPEIRAALELDGGPTFRPGYLVQSLDRLARRDPPEVTRGGRERTGKGRAGRWQLGPAAGLATRGSS